MTIPSDARRSSRTAARTSADDLTLLVFQGSRLVRFADAVLETAICAWSDSIGARIARQLHRQAGAAAVGARVRLTGGVITVASITALALQQLATRPAPLAWLMPAAALIFGLYLFAMATQRAARFR